MLGLCTHKIVNRGMAIVIDSMMGPKIPPANASNL